MAARTRESSLTLPSSRGTLKSTRTKTRLPATSTSRMVSLSMGCSAPLWSPPSGGSAGPGRELGGHEREEVGAAAAVAPFVVVPGDDLHHRPAEDHRALRVDDGRARVAPEVG